MISVAERTRLASLWHKLLPKRLSTQLALMTFVVMTISACSFIYVLLQEEIHRITTIKNEQSLALARNITVTVSNSLLVRDYVSMENSLLRAAEFPGVLELQITDLSGRRLADIDKRNGGPHVVYGRPIITLPNDFEHRVQMYDSELVVIEPIVVGEVVGWVVAHIDYQDIDNTRIRVWKNEGIIGIVIVVSTVLLLVYLLRWPLAAVVKYTKFAGRLVLVQATGEQMPVTDKSIDLQQLGGALNKVSARLKAQNDEMTFAMEELERLAAFPENDPNIVASMNSTGEFLYLNPHGSQLLEQLKLKSTELHLLLPKQHLEIIHECLTKRITRRAIEAEYLGNTFLWTYTPLRSQEIVHCYGMDISEKKFAEEKTKAVILEKSAAEAANVAKSSFLANMSHEIRTPLTAIIGFSETLLDSDQGMEERIYAINTIIGTGKHLLQIINEILDLSKIEAARFEVENIEFSLVPLLDEVRSIADVNASRKNITFDIAYNFPLPDKIKSDPLRLKQVLLNIVSNAIKFTTQGSVYIDVSWKQSDNQIIFEVVDTGIGIASEDLKKLFQPFTQADSSTTRRYGGTGLGLHLSKLFTDKLGGMITVTSTPGKGSCFKLAFPVGQTKDRSIILSGLDLNHQKVNTNNAAMELSGSVLLVDDNEENQKLITLYLRKLGLSVTAASNGAEAIDLALSGKHDLILMDMQMPVVDGIEATRVLRVNDYTRPIIALTANAMKSDVDTYLAAGCDAFLAKPIDREKFVETMRKYLQSKPISQHNEPMIPLHSKLLDDMPDMVELVQGFIAKLPDILKELEKSVSASDWPTIKHKAHDLKSVGGSYGYPEISKIAANMEFEIAKQDHAKVVELLSKLYSIAAQIKLGAPSSSQNSMAS